MLPREDVSPDREPVSELQATSSKRNAAKVPCSEASPHRGEPAEPRRVRGRRATSIFEKAVA